MKNKDSPMYKIYVDRYNRNVDSNWANSLKRLLDSLGFSDLHINCDYMPMLKQRLRNQYIQNLNTSLSIMISWNIIGNLKRNSVTKNIWMFYQITR